MRDQHHIIFTLFTYQSWHYHRNMFNAFLWTPSSHPWFSLFLVPRSCFLSCSSCLGTLHSRHPPFWIPSPAVFAIARNCSTTVDCSLQFPNCTCRTRRFRSSEIKVSMSPISLHVLFSPPSSPVIVSTRTTHKRLCSFFHRLTSIRPLL